jgi:hypothetical protein
MIGLGSSIAKPGKIGKRIVRDGLVLKHDYNAGAVQPCSTGAAYFDDSANDYISIGDPANLNMGEGSFSVSCWAKSIPGDHTSNADFVLGKADGAATNAGADEGYGLYLGNSRTDWVFWAGDGTGSGKAAATDEHVPNQWYHLCGTFDGSRTVKLYVDGVLVSTATTADDTPSAVDLGNIDVDDDFNIGRVGSATSYDFAGYICNAGVWKGVVLTQAQVKSIMHKDYAALSASEKTGLSSWWNLDSTVSEDYTVSGSTAPEQGEPSTITGLVLDNHDTTFTAVSVTNGDFTSGSGATITGWTNDNDSWTRVNDTIVSGASNQFMRSTSLTNGVAHKAIIRAKRTTASSAASLQVYFGANNYAEHALTSDFAEYIFHGIQQDDTTLLLYNSVGDVTVDTVELYKYDGNVGTLA